MYDIKCDTHTHTLYSRHAYSTIKENVIEAKENGMELLASTDHFSEMLWPEYTNLKNYQYLATSPTIWPKEWMGVTLLCGCEVDIVNLQGGLFGQDISVDKNIVGDPIRPTNLYELVTRKMDYVIASIHGKAFTKGASRNQLTDMYIKALQDEKVFILGHLGRSGLDVDFRAIVDTAKSLNKLLEVNEHSFEFGSEAEDSITRSRCKELLEICAEKGCKVSIATDAHVSNLIGRFEKTKILLDEVHFPEELIAGLNRESFLNALKESGIKGRTV